MMTGEQYVASIQKMRPNVYKWGKLIEDVTTHPATRLHVQSVQRSYDLSVDPAKAPVYTSKSPLTGETVHRWNSLMQSAEDVMGNSNMKRAQYHQSGTCQGATCAGWTALNVLWDITWQMDHDLGTHYHERVRKYWRTWRTTAWPCRARSRRQGRPLAAALAAAQPGQPSARRGAPARRHRHARLQVPDLRGRGGARDHRHAGQRLQ